MSEIPQWLQVFAVPVLGILGKLAWPTLVRRTRRHLELLKETPDDLRAPLAELVTYELTVMRDREMGKVDRRISWTTLGSLLVVLVLGAGAFWLLWRPDSLPLNVMAGVVGVFIVLLVAVGASQVWESPAEEKARRDKAAAKKAAKTQGTRASP